MHPIYKGQPNKQIACIDMMSFYASCMATLHNLDVRPVPIAVVGNLQQKGSVVLAASPAMKMKFRIKTGNRIFEIPSHPEIRLFEPKMSITEEDTAFNVLHVEKLEVV